MTYPNALLSFLLSSRFSVRSKFRLECRLLFFPIQTFVNSTHCNTDSSSICCKMRVTFRVIKLSRYVIADVSSKYIECHISGADSLHED